MQNQTPKESSPPPAQQILTLQPVHSDSLFIGTETGSLLQWSTRQRKFLKHYGQLLTGGIAASTTTADKKHLFIGDVSGNLKQISIKLQKVTYDYPRLLKTTILSIATTPNNQYLLVGCFLELRLYQLNNHKIVKKHHFPSAINSVITTSDNQWAFVGLQVGSICQISLDSHTVIKSCNKTTCQPIYSMAVTRDNNFLITGGSDFFHVGKISIKSQEVVKDFCRKDRMFIKTIQLAPGDQSLFVYGRHCVLKLIDLTDGRVIKDFGNVHSSNAYWFQGILVTRSGEYLFTSGNNGGFKQWSVRGRALVQDFDKLTPQINCVCD
jgi:WD40 repeat protein